MVSIVTAAWRDHGGSLLTKYCQEIQNVDYNTSRNWISHQDIIPKTTVHTYKGEERDRNLTAVPRF